MASSWRRRPTQEEREDEGDEDDDDDGEAEASSGWPGAWTLGLDEHTSGLADDDALKGNIWLHLDGQLFKLIHWLTRTDYVGGANSNKTRRRPVSRWSRLVQLLVCYFIIKLSINLSFQYQHDSFIIRRQHFNGSQGGKQVNDSAEAAARLAELRHTLALIGAPFRDSTLVYQLGCCYYLMLLVIFCLSPEFQLRGIHFSLARRLLEPQLDWLEANRLVAHEFDRFLVSYTNYVQKLGPQLGEAAAELRRLHRRRRQRQARQPPPSEAAPDDLSQAPPNSSRFQADCWSAQVSCNMGGGGANIRRPHPIHQLEQQLAELASSGQLGPTLWRGPAIGSARLLAMAKQHLAAGLLLSLQLLVIGVLAGFVLPRLTGSRLLWGPSDVLMLAELFLFDLLLATCAGVFVASVLLNVLDLIGQANELRAQMDDCRLANNRLFSQLNTAAGAVHSKRRPRPTIQHQRRHQMNSNLLLLLLQYKLFVARSRQERKAVGLYGLNAVLLFFLLPLITLLHQPYLDGEQKSFAMLISSMVTLLCDLVLVPICHLHSRSLQLHKCLGNVLAHATRLELEAGERRWMARGPPPANGDAHADGHLAPPPPPPTIYDQHLIWSLGALLAHPDQLDRQFAASVRGFSFTYPNLVRIHFYFSLIGLALHFDLAASNQAALLGDYFRDPLGYLSP